MIGLGAATAAEEGGDRFERVWPSVEVRLRAVLKARGVAPSDWDDLLQEVALRVLTNGVEYDSAADLLPWASTVLRHLHVDAIRRDRGSEAIATAGADAQTAPDTSRVAQARLDLARVNAIVAQWNEVDRAIIRGASPPSLTANAVYVRRNRLRSKLAELIEGSAAWLAWRWRRLNIAASLPVAEAIVVCALAAAPTFDALPAALETPAAAAVRGNVAATVERQTPAASGPASAGSGPARNDVPPRSDGTTPPPRRLRVGDPTGTAPTYGTVERSEADEPLVCAWGVGPVGRACVEDPNGTPTVKVPTVPVP